MDKSNWRPSQGGSGGGGDSSMESADWRAHLPADSRQKIVNKIMDVLKKHLPFPGQEKLHELKNIALRFEEKFYTAATSHSDYMRKISIKLMAIENRSVNPMPNSLPSRSAANSINPSDPGSQGMQQVNTQGQPHPIPVPSNHSQTGQQVSGGVSSSLRPTSGLSQSTMPNISGQNPSFQNVQNISGVQLNSVGVSMSQGIGIPPGTSNFVSQRQTPQQPSQNSQQYFYQQQQLRQIAKQKLQPNNNATSAQSYIQQQHHNLLQPGHFQPSSLSTVPQSAQSVVRQQRQQQQPQPNLLGQQTSATNFQHNQLIGQKSGYSDMLQQHQHSINRHNNFPALHQQHLAQGSQPELLGTQSSPTSMLNNQDSAHLVQSKVSVPQQNQPMQGQRSGKLQHQLDMKPQPNPSQQDMQPRLPTSGAFQQQITKDQQKQLSQQHRAMPEASSTSSDSTAQTGNPNGGDWQEEVYQKIKALKDKYLPELNEMYQKSVGKLQQHNSLHPQPKGELVEKLKTVIHVLECIMAFLQVPKSNISPTHKEKLGVCERNILNLVSTQRWKHGVTLQQSQQAQVQPHENHMNSQMQLVNLQGTMAATRGVSNAKQNMMGATSNLIPGLDSLQQVSGGSQQVNINPLSSQGGMGMMQPNFNMLQNQQLKQQLQHQFLQKQLLHKHQYHRQPKQPQQNEQLQVNQIDQQNLLTSLTKSGTPLQSANSSFIVSASSTPSTSHMPGESEKVNSGVSSLSNAGNVDTPQSVAINTPRISASPLLPEFTSRDGNHGTGASVSGKSIEQPMERLLKVVKSISSKSLSASVSDIGSVVSMIDSIGGLAPGNGSKCAVGEDLVAMTKCRFQAKTFIAQDGITGTRKIKRFTSTMPFNVVSSASSVNCIEASELESTATSTIKRPRIETHNALLEETREINQGLIDTVIDISEEDVNPATAFVGSQGGKGTVVKFSFRAVTLGPNMKSQMLPIQPLRLLVPTNYPNCSPIILDKFPVDLSKEYEDLSIKAYWRFSSCVRRLSEPMSLKNMARTWDVCARGVISEYAQQTRGGGTFTSKHGAWEDCPKILE